MAEEQSGGFFAALKKELFTDDSSASTTPAKKPGKSKAVIPPPEPEPSHAATQTFAYTPPPATPSYPTAIEPGTASAAPMVAGLAAAGAAPVDEAALATLTQKVFPPNEPSLYVQFDNLWGVIGRHQNPAMVLMALKATVPAASVESLSASVNRHVELFDAALKEANDTIQKTTESLLGAADKQTAELMELNKKDQEQIARLMAQIEERSKKLSEIQTDRNNNEAQINANKALLLGAFEHLQARLKIASATVANIPQT